MTDGRGDERRFGTTAIEVVRRAVEREDGFGERAVEVRAIAWSR